LSVRRFAPLPRILFIFALATLGLLLVGAAPWGAVSAQAETQRAQATNGVEFRVRDFDGNVADNVSGGRNNIPRTTLTTDPSGNVTFTDLDSPTSRPRAVLAKEKIHKVVATTVTESVSEAPDGRITLQGIFASKNPRCLSEARYQKHIGGASKAVGATFFYGGDPKGTSAQFVDFGWLPRTAHNVFKRVVSGNTTVHVVSIDKQVKYDSTVGQAQGAFLSTGLGPYKTTYTQHGKKVILNCPRARPVPGSANYSYSLPSEFTLFFTL
jgi:hypothetical protein